MPQAGVGGGVGWALMGESPLFQQGFELPQTPPRAVAANFCTTEAGGSDCPKTRSRDRKWVSVLESRTAERSVHHSFIPH